MRNALLHGELQPHGQAFEAYEPAYRIVMRFLDASCNPADVEELHSEACSVWGEHV
jgi:hypothetical protein